MDFLVVPLMIHNRRGYYDGMGLLFEAIEGHTGQGRGDLPEAMLHLVAILGGHEKRNHTVFIRKFRMLRVLDRGHVS